LVRAHEEFAKAAAPYVCVRVTDMRDVDVGGLRFDFDLTMAIVVMHADGTILHRFGSRDATDPLAWMSIASLARLLQGALEDHAEHERSGSPPKAGKPLRPVDLPPLQRRIARGQKVECVHCHTVNDVEHEWAVEQKRWRDDDKWVHPDPRRVGLVLDALEQELVREVAADSPAARAGLRRGDRLLRLGVQQRVRTVADVAWALHEAPAAATKLPLAFLRGETRQTAELVLAAGWKRCPPDEYAWRPYKWNLSPSAGFGGPELSAAERKELGLRPGQFAFRVGYIVDWGERSHRGAAVKKAGIRKGDVVVGFAGRDDFESVEHWHAFVALTRKAGEEVEVVLLRGGERKVARLVLPE
jgi:hypothetical protein